MPSAKNYYASGAPMWNPKYKPPVKPAPVNSIPTAITSVYGITCSMVSINVPTLEMSILTNGNELLVSIADIVSIDTSVAIMNIHSDDPQSLTIVFLTPIDLQKVNTRLAAVMNGGIDPGCL